MGTSIPATAAGGCAILLWSTLATLTVLAQPVSPLKTTAIAFAIGGLLIALSTLLRGRGGRLWPSPASLALGVYGLFGYHALYFAALRLAPPAEAQLICSLWALFIVLFSGLLPGVQLRARHIAGALLGMAAAGLVAWGKLEPTSTSASARLGFGLALACALIWSTYSVASRLLAHVPSESIAASCLAAAALALLGSLLFEPRTAPPDGRAWLALACLGAGPAGAAFLLWDIGMKKGNVPLLGVLSYSSPILSAALLVALGLAEPTWSLAAACALMGIAGLIATRHH